MHTPYDGRIYHKQCKSLKKAGYDVVLIAPKPKVYESNDIKLIEIVKPKKEITRFLRTLQVVKIARNTKADIYHFHDPELVPVGVILRFITRKPVIFDVHEHYPNAIMSKKYLSKPLKRIMRLMYECVEKISLPFLSGVIYTTNWIGKRYEKYRNCKIENYPIKQMFPENISLSAKVDASFIYLGGITEIRGVIELIEAFCKVVKVHSQATLLFVGRFESEAFKNTVLSKIRDLDLSDNITIKGQVPYEEIKEYLKTTSIGIIPYLPEPNHLVCMPNKLFEYMASGQAVLASNFPNYSGVIEKANCGLTFNPKDPADIAQSMIHLLDNPTEISEYQKNGRLAFDQLYNWEHEEKKLLSFYRLVLTGKY
ncbi:glycosyltransferase family 4 protein [Alkalihalophilus marmarensis]|uniref:glycosyltransferase family 4 protein n=1 Tax=Alkalihalophilus marmarensis TaxID=521377 RepID=UPI00399C9D7F